MVCRNAFGHVVGQRLLGRREMPVVLHMPYFAYAFNGCSAYAFNGCRSTNNHDIPFPSQCSTRYLAVVATNACEIHICPPGLLQCRLKTISTSTTGVWGLADPDELRWIPEKEDTGTLLGGDDEGTGSPRGSPRWAVAVVLFNRVICRDRTHWTGRINGGT